MDIEYNDGWRFIIYGRTLGNICGLLCSVLLGALGGYGTQLAGGTALQSVGLAVIAALVIFFIGWPLVMLLTK